MFCNQCGNENLSDASFCSRCGCAVSSELRDAQNKTLSLSANLFHFSKMAAERLMADKKSLGISVFRSKNKAAQELVIFMIFLCLISTRDVISSSEYNAISVNLVKFFGEKYSGVNADFFITRLKGYESAMQEKRGPLNASGEHNWLWPLCHRALQNVRGDEAEDFFAMTTLMTTAGSFIAAASGMVKEYLNAGAKRS